MRVRFAPRVFTKAPCQRRIVHDAAEPIGECVWIVWRAQKPRPSVINDFGYATDSSGDDW